MKAEIEQRCDEAYNAYQQSPTEENKRRLESANLAYLMQEYIPQPNQFPSVDGKENGLPYSE